MSDRMDVFSRDLRVFMILQGAGAIGAIVIPGGLVAAAHFGVVEVQQLEILVPAFVAYGLAQLPLFFVARWLVRKQTLEELARLESDEDREQISVLYIRKLSFLRLAICEALVLFGGVLYLLEREPVGLVGPAVAFALLVLTFPTRSRWTAIVESLGHDAKDLAESH